MAQIIRLKHRNFLALLLLVALSSVACLKANKPTLPKIFPAPQQVAPKNKPPIIIIPGILGSELVNQRTQKTLWPELFPDDRDALALPIESETLAENRDELIAPRVLQSANLGRLIPLIGVYAGLLKALEDYAAYRPGNLDEPASDGDRDTYYLFAYDWRRDNVEAAHLLAEKINKLKARLNKPELRFDIIAHSMGGLIARYYAMYGARDMLAESAAQPDWSGARNLNRLILIGSPNAGSFDAFRSIEQGYSVTEANRPRLRLFRGLHRRMIFTVPSVYQLLPRNAGARFFNEKLERLPLDLYDVETWRKFHWSAAFNTNFLAEEKRELVKRLGPEKGEAEAKRLVELRERYLRVVLARAQAFQRALDARSDLPTSLRLHLFGGDCEPTIAGALIVNEDGVQKTLFWPNKAMGNRQQRKLALDKIFLPGDGRVIRQSLFGLTLAPDDNEPILHAMKQTPEHTMFNCDLHGDLPLNLIIQNNLLTLLLGNRY